MPGLLSANSAAAPEWLAPLAEYFPSRSGYPGIDGFLGTRASIMLDVVVVAMLLVVPAMAGAIALARYGKRYRLHGRVQLMLASLLLLAVAAFEVDMQLLTEWELRAEPSPYFDPADKWGCPVGVALLVHLLFAVPTLGLWVFVIGGALWKFPRPAAPGKHSQHHKKWGRMAAVEMLMTAVTGWVFYVMAFVA
ncbi:MAG: DUF420 domain-containing protein [Planctomycetota bacterium]